MKDDRKGESLASLLIIHSEMFGEIEMDVFQEDGSIRYVGISRRWRRLFSQNEGCFYVRQV